MARPATTAVGTRIAFRGKGWLALAAIASVMLLAASARGQKSEVKGLKAYIEFEKREPKYKSREPINIVVTFENTSQQPLTVLAWHTPFEGFFSDMFVVRHKGDKAVRYIGPLAKRGDPTAREYFVIPPGRAVRKVLDLSEAYEIREAGGYTVQLRTFIHDYGRESPKILARRRQPKVFYTESNIARFELLRKRRSRRAAEAKLPAFAGCSPEQEQILRLSVWKAQDIALDALGMLNSTAAGDRPESKRYVHWFGAYSAVRYDTAVAHFEDIALALANEEISFNCVDNYRFYAYVIPNKPYEITICNKFWNAPLTETDSQSGTIIHEVSHFIVVADTDDHVYTQEKCELLALGDPKKAIRNADSHEYFAENHPSLEMAESSGWTSCAWHPVGYEKSHSKQENWCPAGSLVTGFDLDPDGTQGGGNSPIVKEVQCCKLAAENASAWGSCSWHPVGFQKSHFDQGDWCPAGSFVTDLDLDPEVLNGPGNSPIVGEVRCCELPSAQLPSWGKSYWFDVGRSRSHDSVLETWCPAGSFVSQLDLDGGDANYGPVVGRVKCTAPAP